MSHRLKVLWTLISATSISVAVASAQPPEPAVNIVAPVPAAQPVDLPLLTLKLEDFLAQHGGLSRLKLKMDKATADEIADEVKQQTGIDLTPQEGLRGAEDQVQRFSVEATGQTFWEAISQWDRGETPLGVQRNYGGRSRWQLTPWNSMQRGRTLTAGPVFLTATYISRSSSRSLNLDPKLEAKDAVPSVAETLSLQSMMQIDPKFAPFIAAYLTEVEGAVDDQGRAILPAESYNYPQQIDDNSYLGLNFVMPPANAKRLSRLKGLIRLAIISKSERWEIDLAATPKAEKSFKSAESEVTVRWNGLATTDLRSVANFRIERKTLGPPRIFKSKAPGASGLQMGEHNDMARSIRFFNAEDEVLNSNPNSSRSGEENGVRWLDLEVTVERDPAIKDLEKTTPAKIQIDVPLEWREVQIPFEWKDLPLP